MEDNKTPRNSRRKCSFCGRSENEVGFLITGMNGCICDSCSEQAYEIMQEAMHQKKGAPGELNLKELGEYARAKGVEIGLWTQSDLHPKEGVEALLQRDIVKEVRDAGVRVLKTDVAWVVNRLVCTSLIIRWYM